MTEFNEADALSADPFAGDFGDGEVTLSDKIVKAAKDHLGRCHDCAGDIAKGERHRARTEAYDGQVVTTRWCAECCAAMAISWEDDGEAWEARNNLGAERRAARKTPTE